MKEILSHCPVCKKRYWLRAITIHIITTAKEEVYKVYKLKGHCGKGSKGKPHEDYILENSILIKKKTLCLKK